MYRGISLDHPRDLAANASALIAALLFGASAVAVRVAVQDIPPLSLAVYRFGQGGMILLFVLLVAARHLLKIRWRDFLYLILLGSIYLGQRSRERKQVHRRPRRDREPRRQSGRGCGEGFQQSHQPPLKAKEEAFPQAWRRW